MSDDVTLTKSTHEQVVSLIDQLIEVSIWQDAEAKSKTPVKNQGDSFMTNKLRLVRDTLTS